VLLKEQYRNPPVYKIYSTRRFCIRRNGIRHIIESSQLHGENDFTEGSKILLDTDLKIILLGHQNNFVGILKIMSNIAKNFDILVYSVLHNYFDRSTKLL